MNLTAFNIETNTPGPTSPPYDFFGSGGGFSNYFAPPSYQAEAVARYLTEYTPSVPHYTVNADASNIGENGGVYNIAGRGYPDVAGGFRSLYRPIVNELLTRDSSKRLLPSHL